MTLIPSIYAMDWKFNVYYRHFLTSWLEIR